MRVFRNTKTRQTRYFVPFVSGLVALFFVSSTAIAQDTTQPDTLLTPAQWRSLAVYSLSVIRRVRSVFTGRGVARVSVAGRGFCDALPGTRAQDSGICQWRVLTGVVTKRPGTLLQEEPNRSRVGKYRRVGG